MPDLEATAQGLTDSLTAVANGLLEVRRWRRRFTATAAVAGLLVAAALGLGGWAIVEVANQQHAACVTSNLGRAANVTLWDHVLSLPSTGRPRTPQQQATIDHFRVYVHRVYRQRDCG